LAWIPGKYYFPLEERTLSDLTSARRLKADEFCLNKNCHHVSADGTPINTREDLTAATSQYKRNPHLPNHRIADCGECHKAHRASVNTCTECHSDAPVPTGWLTFQLEKLIENPW
jgi:hypothetical protein